MAISKQQPMRQAEIALVDAVNSGSMPSPSQSGFVITNTGIETITARADVYPGDKIEFVVEFSEPINSNYYIVHSVQAGSTDVITSSITFKDENAFEITVFNIGSQQFPTTNILVDWAIIEERN